MSGATFSRIVELDMPIYDPDHYVRARCAGEWCEWSTYWADMGL